MTDILTDRQKVKIMVAKAERSQTNKERKKEKRAAKIMPPPRLSVG